MYFWMCKVPVARSLYFIVYFRGHVRQFALYSSSFPRRGATSRPRYPGLVEALPAVEAMPAVEAVPAQVAPYIGIVKSKGGSYGSSRWVGTHVLRSQVSREQKIE